EKYFELIFQRRPVHSLYTYFNYAYFLAKQGQREKGEKYVKEIIQLFPQNHLVLIHAANFYILIKEYDKALEYAKKNYDLFPNRKNKNFFLKIEEIIKKRIN
ncbi:MAG: hypothetical protein N3B16_05465, partial [Candidatus Aminicenantes bacterium]|nr:hypothetical protein [Candidatus Aminicenantes bacterium]